MVVIMHDLDHCSTCTVSIPDSPCKSTKRVTFVEALHDKYIDQEELCDRVFIPKDKSISTEITFVGFGKVSSIQKQLKRLTSIDLSGRNITVAGDIGELQGTLERVTLLNLAGNNLTWKEIINVVTCLPNLKEIILTANDLEEAPKEYPTHRLDRLISLTLGRIGIDWSEILTVISNIWESVEQIDLWDNQLDSARFRLNNSRQHALFTERLLELRLSQNNFNDIDWICDAGSLGNLTDLDLSRCKIETLSISGEVISQLRSLRSLNISYNNISQWESISNLYSLPNLMKLICNDNPFFITEKLAKSYVVARLGTIKFLNREEITRNTRRDSEILYLRKTFPEYRSFKQGINERFQRLHPRYEVLIDLYGAPEDLEGRTAAEKYVIVNLCHGDKRVNKKLPFDMRVSNLKMLCKRLFKLKPSSRLEITCKAQEGKKTSCYPLDKECQTLHFFSVKNDNDLVVCIDD